MSDEVSVKFTTQDEAKAFAAFVRLRRETKEAGESVAEAGVKTDRADAALRRFADNVRKVNASPIERLNAELAKLKEASDKGFLDPSEYARAVASANSKAFEAAMAPNEKASKAMLERVRAEAEQTKRVMAETMAPNKDAVASVREFERAQVKAQNTAQREIKETAQETGRLDTVIDSTATRSGRSFGKMAQGVKVAFRAAATAVTAVLGEISQATEQAANQVKQAAGPQGQLSQLPNAQELRPIVTEVRKAGAAESLGEASNVVFALESAGATAERDTFIKLRAANVIESVEKTVNATAALKSSMGDADVGTFTDAIAKALAAAKVGKGTVEQILQAAGGKAGTFAKQQGASDDEVLAAISVISQQTRSPDTAGEYLGAFLRETSQKQELQGKSLMDAVAEIDSKNLGTEDLAEYIGSSEGMVAFSVLRDRAKEVKALAADVEKAGTQSDKIISRSVDDALSQPGQRAALANRKSEAMLEISSQETGQQKLQTDAVVNTIKSQFLSGEKEGIAQTIFGKGQATQAIDAGVISALDAKDPIFGVSPRSIPGVDWFIRNQAEKSNDKTIRGIVSPEQKDFGKMGAEDREAVKEQLEAARMMREAAQTMRDAAREQRDARSVPTFSWSARAQQAQAVPAE